MRHRVLAVAVLAALVGLLALPATAAPTPSPTTEPEDPIRVVVTDLLPRAPHPGDAVEVKGTLRNIGSKPVTDLRVRLQTGGRIRTRGELHDADADRPPTQPRVSQSLPGTLAPGHTVQFDLRTDVATLRLGDLGVYPMDIVARGNAGDGMDSLGLASTWLPWFAGLNPHPTRIAVLWPLVDVPHRRPDGTFGDDSLAQSVAARGRLGQLTLAARTAQSPACELAAIGPGGTPGPRPTRCDPVEVTFGIDPDLLESVQAMTHPYRVKDGSKTRTGAGVSAASQWLAALRSLGLNDRVIGLPYADPDASALGRTARGLDDLTNAAALTPDVVAQVLGVAPDATIAWPPSGPVTPAAANALALGGARTFVLDPSAYADEGTPPDRTPGALSVFTSSATGAELHGLVLDPDLSELLGPSGDQGARLAEQRFLVETAIVAAEAPGISRTLLVVPARRGTVAAAVAGNELRDLGRVPWLCPVNVTSAAAGDASCSGQPASQPAKLVERGVARTDDDSELSPSYLRHVAADRALGVQLTDFVMSSDPAYQRQVAVTKASLLRAVARAESSAGRTDSGVARATSGWLHDQVTSLAGSVVVRGGRSLLTSKKGQLSVSIENTLGVPVQVRVRFTSKTATLTNADTGLVTVQPGHAVEASVKAEAQRSGQFVVFAQILDRNGKPFGQEAQVIVRSTRFGRLALAVTVAAFAVLMFAAGFRIFRRAVGGS